MSAIGTITLGIIPIGNTIVSKNRRTNKGKKKGKEQRKNREKKIKRPIVFVITPTFTKNKVTVQTYLDLTWEGTIVNIYGRNYHKREVIEGRSIKKIESAREPLTLLLKNQLYFRDGVELTIEKILEKIREGEEYFAPKSKRGVPAEGKIILLVDVFDNTRPVKILEPVDVNDPDKGFKIVY